MRYFLMVVALCLFATFSQATELTLFDIPLRVSSREAVRSAIIQAGGQLTSSSKDSDQYNASKIGLPGATSLEVVYLDGKFVLAQYSFTMDAETEERLRKMIVSKYGNPQGGKYRPFDGQFIDDGKYRWIFDQKMELIFTAEFFGARYLTYVNRYQQSQLEQLVKEQDRRAAEKEADKKKSIF
jgi:hypothetical protein